MAGMFGLPENVEYCTRCAMSNQKPNSSIEYQNTSANRDTMALDDDGICAACHYADTKGGIDWGVREEKLIALLDQYRRSDGRYDVVVPVSGGKDSIYAAHLLKYRYGMNPLTVTWAPHIYRDEGWRNLHKMIDAGFDNILYTPNGKVHRQLTKLAFVNLLHPFQPFVFGQKNVGPRISIQYDIPLVMYGESNVEYGDPVASDDDLMTEEYFSLEPELDDIYLGGVSARDLINDHGLSLNDLKPYFPIHPQELRKEETKVHYLGYYMNWDPQECYYYSVEHCGFETSEERNEGTFSKYSELDDKLIPLSFYCMHVKFGIGRAMYDAVQEVRNNKITREESVALINKFDGEYPARWLNELLEYMDITKTEFDTVVDRFRPPHLWEQVDGAWKLKQPPV